MQAKKGNILMRGLRHLFQLEKYGNSLLTRRVLIGMNIMSIVLLGTFLFLVFNWYEFGKTVFVPAQAVAIALFVPLVLIVVDITYFIADRRTTSAGLTALRVMLGVLLALFSSLSFQMNALHDDTVNLLRRDTMTDAKKVIETHFKTQIEDKKREAERYRAQRTTDRTALTQKQNAQFGTYNEAEKKAVAAVQAETENVDRMGYGKLAKSIKEMQDAQSASLASLRNKAQVETESFDAKTAGDLAEKDLVRLKLEEQMANEIKLVPAQSTEGLRAKYGIPPNDGFIARINALYVRLPQEVTVTFWVLLPLVFQATRPVF